MSDNTTSHDNMYKGASSALGYYGVIPVTIDSTRSLPYIQYAFRKNPADGQEAHGGDGVSLPDKYLAVENGPIFLVSFTVNRTAVMSAEDLNSVLKPVVHGFPKHAGDFQVYSGIVWDDEDSELSLWLDNTSAVLTAGKQYTVATKPLPAESFNNMPAGISYFSLMPTDAVDAHDGLELGILGVTYRFKLQEPTL